MSIKIHCNRCGCEIGDAVPGDPIPVQVISGLDFDIRFSVNSRKEGEEPQGAYHNPAYDTIRHYCSTCLVVMIHKTGDYAKAVEDQKQRRELGKPVKPCLDAGQDDLLPDPELAEKFVDVTNKVSLMIHENAVQKGWWEEERNDGEMLMLVVSELAEGLEALRLDVASDKIPEFHGIEEEVADAIIRLLDFTHSRGWRVAEALLEKMKYNRTRPYKHGKKF